MRITNPIQMNDWPIKKFLIMIFTFQLLLWGSIGLDSIGFRIPILRQLVSIIYLTFVPGIIILRVLRLHKLESTESLLYSIGLSLSTLMSIGFFMNIFYPLIGVSKPISIVPLVITVSVIVLILCIFSYIVDKNFFDTNASIYVDFSEPFSKQSLLLYCIPLISIFGTYLVNFYMDNTFIILFLILIVFLIYLVEFDLLQDEYYPLLIFSISISLLYHTSLMSSYLVEWADVSFEYWFSKNVLIYSIWDPTIYSNVNSMLSIVMIAPIYSILCNLSLTWVYKLVYPFFFSFVPVGLFNIYNKQTNNKTAFYSVFFFMSMFAFYTTMLGLARQQLAELFFVLIITLLANKNVPQTAKSELRIIFVFSMIVSHYAFSYIFIGCLIISWFSIYIVSDNNIFDTIKRNEFNFLRSRNLIKKEIEDENKAISTTFVLLTVVFAFSWYMYFTNSSVFNSIIYIGNDILSNIIQDFLSAKDTQGLNILLSPTKTGLLGQIYKIIHLSTQIFILVGLTYSLLSTKSSKIQTEYLAISIPFIFMCIAGILIPHFASTINTDRLYGISLLILSPYCIIGGIFIQNLFAKVFKLNILNPKNILRFFSIFLSIYFLFNSGLIYEFCGYHTSYSLNPNVVNRTDFDIYEVSGATWGSKNIQSEKNIYASAQDAYLIQMECGEFYPFIKGAFIPDNDSDFTFIGSHCIRDNILWLDDPESPRINVTSIKYSDSKSFNRLLTDNTLIINIYNNGYTKIYSKADTEGIT